jgi:hypothetical protein
MLESASVPFEKIFDTPRIATTDRADACGRAVGAEMVSVRVKSGFRLE